MSWGEKAKNSEGNRCGIPDGDLPDIGGGGVFPMTTLGWRKQGGKLAGGGRRVDRNTAGVWSAWLNLYFCYSAPI